MISTTYEDADGNEVSPESIQVDFCSGTILPDEIWITEKQYKLIRQLNTRLWMFDYVNRIETPWSVWNFFKSFFQLPGQYPVKHKVIETIACFYCKGIKDEGYPIPYCTECAPKFEMLIPTQQHRHLGNFVDALTIISTCYHIMTPEEEARKRYDRILMEL